MKSEWRKNIRISIIYYLFCVINALLLNFQNDYSKLNNGMVIILLFYGQLLLILFKLVYINKVNNTRLALTAKIEITLKTICFVIININISIFGIHINIIGKIIIIISSIILSGIIMIYQYVAIFKSKDIKILEAKFENLRKFKKINEKNKEHISIIGIILYFYAVSIINDKIGIYTFALKFLLFCSGYVLITKRIRTYRSDIKKTKLFFISLGLISGFTLNCIVAIILSYYINYINIENFNGIRDSMFLVAILCATPLIKEYVNFYSFINDYRQ
jgi:hypothetical protein